MVSSVEATHHYPNNTFDYFHYMLIAIFIHARSRNIIRFTDVHIVPTLTDQTWDDLISTIDDINHLTLKTRDITWASYLA